MPRRHSSGGVPPTTAGSSPGGRRASATACRPPCRCPYASTHHCTAPSERFERRQLCRRLDARADQRQQRAGGEALRRQRWRLRASVEAGVCDVPRRGRALAARARQRHPRARDPTRRRCHAAGADVRSGCDSRHGAPGLRSPRRAGKRLALGGLARARGDRPLMGAASGSEDAAPNSNSAVCDRQPSVGGRNDGRAVPEIVAARREATHCMDKRNRGAARSKGRVRSLTPPPQAVVLGGVPRPLAAVGRRPAAPPGRGAHRCITVGCCCSVSSSLGSSAGR